MSETTSKETITSATPEAPWNESEKVAFRISFIFFILILFPFNLVEFFQRWFKLFDWKNLHIRDIGSLTGGGINFLTIHSESGEFGIASYVNWGIALVLAIAAGTIWSLLDKKPRNYRLLYYLSTAAVALVLAARLNGLTFSKVFPSQMPDLAVTQLNTNFGDFTPQKLYWIQMSFVHNYETFVGLAELVIMLLLFFRQTRSVGAVASVFMIGNISIANHVYDGGVHVLASLYVIGGIYVLWPYLVWVWKLLIKEENVKPEIYFFAYSKNWQKYLHVGVKSVVFVVFFILSAYLHYDNYKYDSYKVPARPGLANARGYYEVTEFRLNNKVIPYSPVDTIRWQNATFEKWSTLSYTVANTFHIHGEAGRGKQFKDVDRTYESAGTGGGHKHYYYEQDTVKQTLTLFNKNKEYKNEKLQWSYRRPTPDRIILEGLNEFKDTIYVVLDKREREYPLYKGRREPLTAIVY